MFLCRRSCCFTRTRCRQSGWGWLLTLSLVLAAFRVEAVPLNVFVSVLPQKYFVERVGGAQVSVEVMVRPGMNPGSYDPTPLQLERLSRSAAYIRTGVPFEDVWIPRIRSKSPSVKIFDGRKGIVLQPVAAERGTQSGHQAERGHEGRLDPHIWTAPPLMKQQALVIRDALTGLMPEKRSLFEANYRRFASELDLLDADIRKLLADKKERRFMVFHPAWGYFAHAYGLQQVAIEVEGKEPGPKALARLIETARLEKVRVIFVQKQFSRVSAEAVARAIGGEVVAIDPLAEDVPANTRAVAVAMAKAMR